jgi:hypothetical protein
MRALEWLLPDRSSQQKRRKVLVLHGLGGTGKTQLAVEFARANAEKFSAIFWLDGTTIHSLQRSFLEMAQRLPVRDLTVEGVAAMKKPIVNVHVAVRESLRWLSLSSNQEWLLVFDNVDRDYHDKNDLQAYDVKNFFPNVDRGSILITSRLVSLQRMGKGLKVGEVDRDQAKEMMENIAGAPIRGEPMAPFHLN